MFEPTNIRFSLKQLLVAMTLVAVFVYFIGTWVLGLLIVQVALPTIVGVIIRLFGSFLPNHVLPWAAVGMLLASIVVLWIFMINQYGLTDEVAIIHACYLVFWIPQLFLMDALVRRRD
ncbi:MAG: hypothetical protein AAGD11_01760 [Planctomycetota bacterium]